MEVQTIKNELSWLQKHERLLIVFLLLVASCFLGNKYLNYRVQHDTVASVQSEQVLEMQKQANDKLAAQIQTQQQQYNTMNQMWQEQNRALMSRIDADNQALKQRQQVNATLPLPELGNRWKTLLELSDGDLTANQTGITVSDKGARETVNQLERVPVLQANVNDLTVVNSNKDQQITKLNDLNSGLNTQVTGLNAQIKDKDKACNDQINLIKSKENKSKRNWFVAGTILGTAGKYLIKILLP